VPTTDGLVFGLRSPGCGNSDRSDFTARCPEPRGCSTTTGERLSAATGTEIKYMIMSLGRLGATPASRPPERVTAMHELVQTMDGELR